MSGASSRTSCWGREAVVLQTCLALGAVQEVQYSHHQMVLLLSASQGHCAQGCFDSWKKALNWGCFFSCLDVWRAGRVRSDFMSLARSL